MTALLDISVKEGISVPGYIAVGGLVLAILAIVLGPLLLRIRRHRSELNEISARLWRAERIGELVCTSLNRGLLGIDNTLDSSSALVHRLLVGRAREIDPLKAIELLRAQRVAVERAVNEVRLLTGSSPEKLSSLQQLAYRIGDERTVHSLTEMVAVGGFDGVSRETLLRAQQALTGRLIHQSSDQPRVVFADAPPRASDDASLSGRDRDGPTVE